MVAAVVAAMVVVAVVDTVGGYRFVGLSPRCNLALPVAPDPGELASPR